MLTPDAVRDIVVAARPRPISPGCARRVFRRSVSIFQAQRQRSGAAFEERVAAALAAMDIPFVRQVRVRDGRIEAPCLRARRGATAETPLHVVDFVAHRRGAPPRPGDAIGGFVVVSAKTTCRERWTQDAWTRETPPLGYYLVTMRADYPSADRFGESPRRKIATLSAKARGDDRTYKLDLNGAIRDAARLLRVRVRKAARAARAHKMDDDDDVAFADAGDGPPPPMRTRKRARTERDAGAGEVEDSGVGTLRAELDALRARVAELERTSTDWRDAYIS
jgi:hypothetical protein